MLEEGTQWKVCSLHITHATFMAQRWLVLDLSQSRLMFLLRPNFQASKWSIHHRADNIPREKRRLFRKENIYYIL